MKLSELRAHNDGKLPAFAWPGGYPILYLCEGGGVICPACANGENGSDAHESNDDPQWHLEEFFIHYEGAEQICDHCCAGVESAYGETE